ncbi:MAG: response regulator, partial [Nitrospirota bacterium]|nr:response regulator [Nitrospirota bacterium]
MSLVRKKSANAGKKDGPIASILVVEDDKGLNRLLQNVLKQDGFITDGVLTGAEALSRASDNPDTVLLLDYMLPDITGKEIVTILDEKKIKAPFIIMTGQGDEKTAVEMMKLGARDYIVKDIRLTDMIPHVIKRVVNEINREKELAEAEKAVVEWQKDMSILYRISTAISQTIDMENLFTIILDTITSLELFSAGQNAGIFLVEGDRMNLVSSRGHPAAFIEMHRSIRVGDCLCGLAAKTGEVMVSKNCMKDIRHTIRYPGMTPHGHIIIPLHARGKITGVLFLYLKADAEIKEEKLKLLTSIGNQIGIAIENSKLYEETKKFALRDPLTGLANRRMMDIVFDRTLERAKRFNKPFSVIMLDIDYFKKYND